MYYNKYLQCLILLAASMVIANAFNTSNDASKSDSSDSRIMGGSNALRAEFPWQVALWNKNKKTQTFRLFCSGSIIKRQWVLTAGHCLYGYDFNNIFIQIGKTNLNDFETFERKIDILRYIIHPEFDDDTLDNDIGLVKLRHPLEYSGDVGPISIAMPEATFADTRSIASGWGYTSYDEQNPAQTIVNPNLQKVSLRVWPDIYCDKIPSFICAGGTPEGGSGVCSGDSGGPLQCLMKGEYVLIGVVSHGIPCTKPREPDYFARISFYHDWIISTITINILE